MRVSETSSEQKIVSVIAIPPRQARLQLALAPDDERQEDDGGGGRGRHDAIATARFEDRGRCASPRRLWKRKIDSSTTIASSRAAPRRA